MTSRSRLGRAVVAVVALVSLSACRVDSVVTVDMAHDGSGTVTIEAIADAAVVQAAPGLAGDLRFDDAIASGWTVDGPTATDDGGLRVVLTRPFANVDEANVLLRSISGSAGPLRDVTLSRTGGTGSDGLPDGSSATHARKPLSHRRGARPAGRLTRAAARPRAGRG